MMRSSRRHKITSRLYRTESVS